MTTSTGDGDVGGGCSQRRSSDREVAEAIPQAPQTTVNREVVTRNGVALLSGRACRTPVTLELVNRLRDETR